MTTTVVGLPADRTPSLIWSTHDFATPDYSIGAGI